MEANALALKEGRASDRANPDAAGKSPTLIKGCYPVDGMPNAAKMQILQDNRSQLDQIQNSVRFQAATTQLELAITFYLVAAAAKDQHTSERAIIYAQRAYAIAASSLDCNLKAGQNYELEEKFILLNAVRAICPPNALFAPSERGSPRRGNGRSPSGKKSLRMRTPYCILKVLGDVLDDGELHFVTVARTLEAARRRVRSLGKSCPGEYVIYNPQTGERLQRVRLKEWATLIFVNSIGRVERLPCLVVDRSHDGFRLRVRSGLRQGQLVDLILDEGPSKSLRCSVASVAYPGSKQEGRAGPQAEPQTVQLLRSSSNGFWTSFRKMARHVEILDCAKKEMPGV